jgi:hypothetical protein
MVGCVGVEFVPSISIHGYSTDIKGGREGRTYDCRFASIYLLAISMRSPACGGDREDLNS